MASVVAVCIALAGVACSSSAKEGLSSPSSLGTISAPTASPTSAVAQSTTSSAASDVSCGDEYGGNPNLSWPRQIVANGIDCSIAQAVAADAPQTDASYASNGFSCTSIPGPTTGEAYVVYTCTHDSAVVTFRFQGA